MRPGPKLQPRSSEPSPVQHSRASPQRGQTSHSTRRTPRPGGSLRGHSHPPPLLSSREPVRKKAFYGGQTAINRYSLRLRGGLCQGEDRANRQESGAMENRADWRGAGAAREKPPDPGPLPAPVLDAARRQRFSRNHPCRGCGWAEGSHRVVRAQPRATLPRSPRSGDGHCILVGRNPPNFGGRDLGVVVGGGGSLSACPARPLRGRARTGGAGPPWLPSRHRPHRRARRRAPGDPFAGGNGRWCGGCPCPCRE